MSRRTLQITADLMLRAYRHGLFPMAETRRGDRLYWLDPERRGILPLDQFRVPHQASGSKKCDHNVGAFLDDGFADPNKSAHSPVAPVCIVMVDAEKIDQPWSTNTLSHR